MCFVALLCSQGSIKEMDCNLPSATAIDDSHVMASTLKLPTFSFYFSSLWSFSCSVRISLFSTQRSYNISFQLAHDLAAFLLLLLTLLINGCAPISGLIDIVGTGIIVPLRYRPGSGSRLVEWSRSFFPDLPSPFPDFRNVQI